MCIRDRIGSELMLQLENLNRNLEMLSNFEPGFENDIDSLMQAHHHNFIVKNIGLIEYIDFTESYICLLYTSRCV